MKKYRKSYNEIYHERKRTIGSLLLLVAVFIAVVMGVRFLVDFIDLSQIRSILEAPAEEHKYPNLYNASRYFFRIYYPDDWSAEGGANGFMKDDASGLVAELYPLIYQDPVTPGPEDGPDATPVILLDKVRDRSLTVSFYYREYTEEQKQLALSAVQAAETETEGGETAAATEEIPTPGTAGSSGGPLESTAEPAPVKKMDYPELLEAVTAYVFGEYTASADESTVITPPEVYETDLYYFGKFTVSYTDLLLIRHSKDVYVAVRASNYIIIEYSADGIFNGKMTPDSYAEYKDAFLDILNEFRLSVFDD